MYIFFGGDRSSVVFPFASIVTSPRVQKVEQQRYSFPPYSSIREESMISIESSYTYLFIVIRFPTHNNRIPDKKIGESKARLRRLFLSVSMRVS